MTQDLTYLTPRAVVTWPDLVSEAGGGELCLQHTVPGGGQGGGENVL